jgi:photosystem II stability/assembly factor-like uncharacterized protein
LRFFFAAFRTRPKQILILAGIALTIGVGILVPKLSSRQGDNRPESASPGRAFTAHDELYSIHINPNGTGWTVGKFGRILHSQDGGKNWTQQNSGTGKPLTSVSFSDDTHGFAVGGGGIILATADGGRSWQPQSSGTRDHLLEVSSPGAASAFVAGAFGTLLSTRDGGVSWVKHGLSWNSLVPRLIRERGQVEPHLNTVYFVDEKEGWLGGEFGLLLHSRDGGQTWIASRFGADFPQIVCVRFRGRFTGWAVGARGTVLSTNDGGRTWRKIEAGTKRDLYAVWIDGRRGLIAGQGVMLEINNGAVKTMNLDLSPNESWFSGAAGVAGTAVVVGQAATIRRVTLSDAKLSSSREKAAAP